MNSKQRRKAFRARLHKCTEYDQAAIRRFKAFLRDRHNISAVELRVKYGDYLGLTKP